MFCYLVLPSSLFLAACFSTRGPTADEVRVDPRYHRVTDGESLWSIGQRYGVDAEDIARLNKIKNPRQIPIGKLLLVGFFPRDQTRASLRVPDQVRTKPRLAWPVRAGKLISRFGPRSGSFHDGIDIGSPQGTPVYSAHSGRVLYAGRRLAGYGNLIVIKGNDGLLTVYAHNKRLLVSSGQRVSRGQKVAEVGATGRASGPHLHFEVRSKDSRARVIALDPLPLLQGNSGEKPRFRVNESLLPLQDGSTNRK